MIKKCSNERNGIVERRDVCFLTWPSQYRLWNDQQSSSWPEKSWCVKLTVGQGEGRWWVSVDDSSHFSNPHPEQQVPSFSSLRGLPHCLPTSRSISAWACAVFPPVVGWPCLSVYRNQILIYRVKLFLTSSLTTHLFLWICSLLPFLLKGLSWVALWTVGSSPCQVIEPEAYTWPKGNSPSQADSVSQWPDFSDTGPFQW